MPSRVLRPQIVHSERWNRVQPMAQSLFIRILTMVDDFGRFEFNPRLLASLCYPYGDHKGRTVTAEKMMELVAELGTADLLVTYEVGENRYLELNRFYERKRSAAKYPGRDASRSVAGSCQQMPADVDNGGQLRPPPTTTTTTTTTRERIGASLEKTASQTPADPAGGAGVTTQDWGILRAHLERVEKQLKEVDPETDPEQRLALLAERKKTRAAFTALSSQQADAVARKVMGETEGAKHD